MKELSFSSDADPTGDLTYVVEDVYILTGTHGAWTIVGDLTIGTISEGDRLVVRNAEGESSAATVESFRIFHTRADRVTAQIRLDHPIERAYPIYVTALKR